MLKKIFNKLMGASAEAISFKQAVELTGLPIITLYQGEKRFNFILDTGSTDNIIDQNILKELDYEVQKSKHNLYGLEGNEQTVNTCSITLSYKDKDFPFIYLINDLKKPFEVMKKENGVTLHGMLGSKFFNAYKYILDFNELIAYSKA